MHIAYKTVDTRAGITSLEELKGRLWPHVILKLITLYCWI